MTPEEELESLRHHPIVQPRCTTCERISVLTKMITEGGDGS